MDNRNDLVAYYFQEGYTQAEIIYFLFFSHGILISSRHLQRILKKLNLRRKNVEESSIEEIVMAIVEETTNGSGTCLGYKSLWKRLKTVYGLQIKRETVLQILRIADPEGIITRSKQRLRRRKYIVPGPNFLWHVDGFDKLKKFGFAIHGAIDGFSRKIIWLKVATTNNNPKVIASYYLNAIKELKFVPTLLRTDKGTENSIISCLQCYLRYDHDDQLAGLKSYIEGKSTSNQRIESYWSQMRRLGMNWWILFFKDMLDEGIFNCDDVVCIECLRYCFGHLIQYELDLLAKEWNNHSIRKQKNVELPPGKPTVLYNLPYLFNTRNYGKTFEEDHLDYLIDKYSEEPKLHGQLFSELVEILIPNVTQPKTIESAKEMYISIMNVINNCVN